MEETTIFFGKMAAAYFLVTGLGFLFSTGFYEKMVLGNASTDRVILSLSGPCTFWSIWPSWFGICGLEVFRKHSSR